MNRELTCQVPFKRLRKLRRSLRRQAFLTAWTEAERNGLVRGVFARMSAEAQKRSQKNIAALLQQAGQA